VRVFERVGLARGIQLLRKSLKLGTAELILRRIVLEVILEGQRVFLIDDVVSIAVDLDGVELRTFSQKLNLPPSRGRIANQEIDRWAAWPTAGPSLQNRLGSKPEVLPCAEGHSYEARQADLRFSRRSLADSCLWSRNVLGREF
jgi:hypothetical protein